MHQRSRRAPGPRTRAGDGVHEQGKANGTRHAARGELFFLIASGFKNIVGHVP